MIMRRILTILAVLALLIHGQITPAAVAQTAPISVTLPTTYWLQAGSGTVSLLSSSAISINYIASNATPTSSSIGTTITLTANTPYYIQSTVPVWIQGAAPNTQVTVNATSPGNLNPSAGTNPGPMQVVTPTGTSLTVSGTPGGPAIPVTGTFSATLGGFAPTPSYVTATAPSGSASAGAALPTGTVVVFYNNGAYPVSIKLGVGSATATAANDIVAAGGWLALTVGSNTYFSAYGIGGSSALVLSGGSGLATGVGGGSSGGGGGTVTQGPAASSGPWIETPWIGGAVNSATNGLYFNILQGNAVNASGNPIFTQLTAGAATIGNVGVNNQPVGSAAFATAQATPGTSATSIVAARTGTAGTGRIAAIIINMSTTPVYLGGSGVTTSTGQYLAGVVGAAIVIPTTAAIYGVVTSGTGSVSVQELY